jgi:hypothetical protein
LESIPNNCSRQPPICEVYRESSSAAYTVVHPNQNTITTKNPLSYNSRPLNENNLINILIVSPVPVFVMMFQSQRKVYSFVLDKKN